MKIYIGSDHAGFELKQTIIAHLSNLNYEVEDVGNKVHDPVDDYPEYAFLAATKLLGEEDNQAKGILLCGSGQGVCIAANRVHGVRASLVWNPDVARETRQHNDSNILCLPASLLSEAETLAIVDTWLKTPFSGEERHVRRIKEIEEVYG